MEFPRRFGTVLLFSSLLTMGRPLLPFALPVSAQARPQEAPRAQTVRLFMDCSALACFDLDYFRQEIPFVSWVRDIRDADVYVLITAQGTGSGGIASELIFEGRNQFEGKTDTLTFISMVNSTTDDQRRGLAGVMKIGLMRYVGLTPIAREIEIGLRPAAPPGGPGRPEPALGPGVLPEEDPWDFWVFSLSGRTSVSGESIATSASLNGSFTASRTTEEWKLSFRLSSSYSERDYDSPDIPDYFRREHTFSSTIVRSLTGRWSAGLKTSARNSTYYNYNLSGSISPVLEFSLFPYAEATRRSVSFRYTLNAVYNDYREETVYFKNEESLLTQSLSVAVGYTQPWGSAYGSVEATHQLGDLGRHHVGVFGGSNLRLSRGLSLTLSAQYSRVHDRISVAAVAGSTPEDVLLRRRQLQTDFTYSLSVGLTYRFGSLFNNVVNPRLEGPTMMFIMM